MHVIQLLPELRQGGVERGVVELSRELVRRGHVSTIVSLGGPMVAQLEREGATHLTLDVRNKNLFTVPARVAALRRAIASMRPAPDILHPRSRVPAWLTVLANRRQRIPLVTTVHGFNSVSRYSAVMTRGERVIYGSPAIRDYVLANYPVDPKCLRYVPRGIDLSELSPADVDAVQVAAWRREWGLDGRFVISMVGRITEWKGHEVFLRALAVAQRSHPQIKGLIVGGVAEDRRAFFASLQALASELGVDVVFAGSQSAVREVYALSDVVVSAAHSKAETFGRVAAEALALDTPVIASAHGGSLDIVLDGVNGFLFAPGDADALAARMVDATTHGFRDMRSHVEANFSLERMVEAELAVYEEVLAGTPQRSRQS